MKPIEILEQAMKSQAKEPGLKKMLQDSGSLRAWRICR